MPSPRKNGWGISAEALAGEPLILPGTSGVAELTLTTTGSEFDTGGLDCGGASPDWPNTGRLRGATVAGSDIAPSEIPEGGGGHFNTHAWRLGLDAPHIALCTLPYHS